MSLNICRTGILRTPNWKDLCVNDLKSVDMIFLISVKELLKQFK